MQYIELTIHTSSLGSELVSDVLWNFTEGGVAIQDVNDVIALSNLKRGLWDYIDSDLITPNSDVLCKCYIPKENESAVSFNIEQALAELKKNSLINLGSLEIVKREVDGDEWVERWKEHFKPIHIGKIVICPEWITYAEKAGEVVTKIDTNMAFGTGEHETTAMCLELLEEYIKPQSTVIDVGCGSGILGITASKLGAKQVIMTDLDECAITATNHNAEINKISGYSVELKNLLDDNKIVGDILLANIMAETLIMFSKDISKNIVDGGIIILSGILTTKKEEVLNAYLSAKFSYLKEIVKGEWCALALKK